MTPALLVYLTGTVFIAGLIKGFSGFGLAMVIVLTWSMVLPPATAVPVIILLDAAAGLAMLPGVWKRVDWRSLTWLYIGVAAGTPAGVFFLSRIPAEPMKVFISFTVLILAGLLWKGIHVTAAPGRTASTLTGFVSGILNGSSSIGGPPVILYYLSLPGTTAVSRASMVAYFFVTDALASVSAGFQGLITWQTFVLLGVSFPSLMVGIAVGNRFFVSSSEQSARQKVLVLLIGLAVVSLARALF